MMNRMCLLLSILNAGLMAETTHWKAGAARVPITPPGSICMWGYMGVRLSEGQVHDIHTKALAIEDPLGNRVVIVTLDLTGFEWEMVKPVAARLQRRHGLDPKQLLFSASHTHTGPLVRHVRRPIELMYDLDSKQRAEVERYTRSVEDRIVEAVSSALQDLAPARLSFHRGRADFAVSRRLPTPSGIQMANNPEGLVDHEVPVLKVSAAEGGTRAILFGYTCHPVTLNAPQISGDYAGFAQDELEAARRGTVALFVQGCGGDSWPSERGSLESGRKYGRTLAEAVSEALASTGTPVRGSLATARGEVRLPLAPLPSREEFEKRLQDEKDYVRKHAEHMLSQIDGNVKLATHSLLPVQAIQMGSSLTMVALGGEPVVDYALRLKRELGDGTTWIVGYSNDVTFYVPSVRVLQEGGYEPYHSQLLVGLPGPFAPAVEEILVSKVHELVRQVRSVP